MPFSDLELSQPLLERLHSLSFVEPTPIQSAVIDAAIGGRDVLATAQTGSGKTAAFVLPILERWRANPKAARALILAPTRELVQQIKAVFDEFIDAAPGCKMVAIYGGVSINPQLMALRGGADIIVATPGRLLDVMQHNGVDLWHTRCLVLDEADKLLNASFAAELDEILENVAESCQTLMLSATFGPKLHALAKRLLRDPLRIDIPTQALDIQQRAIEVDQRQKAALLEHLIKAASGDRFLVFCASKDRADQLSDTLEKDGIRAAALYGGLSQDRRDWVLRQLKRGKLQVLVASDLASRGVDIPQLPVVVNYDLPRSTQDFTHRIGRTGRAGETGLAISFIDADSHAHFSLIEKRHQFNVKRERIEGFIPQDKPTERLLVADDNGGIKGKRPSKKDKLRAAKAQQKTEH
ncbi:MAG: DEAD/DEAH box helicase [Gammaproteobacteria bacterium]|nr:DEAD/DEAH box helicase [Gammaproteobacteria bacterium]